MTRNYQKFEDYLVNKLKDPVEARIFLEIAIEEYEDSSKTNVFMLSLRYLAAARVK